MAPRELALQVDTWIAPWYTMQHDPEDGYPAYNKPGAVVDWMQGTTPEEEYILVIDSDMVLRWAEWSCSEWSWAQQQTLASAGREAGGKWQQNRQGREGRTSRDGRAKAHADAETLHCPCRRPFLVEDMQPSKGWAIGAMYTYMIGVNNELAVRHVPEIAPRNDTLAGPEGRRGDQVRESKCLT